MTYSPFTSYALFHIILCGSHHGSGRHTLSDTGHPYFARMFIESRHGVVEWSSCKGYRGQRDWTARRPQVARCCRGQRDGSRGVPCVLSLDGPPPSRCTMLQKKRVSPKVRRVTLGCCRGPLQLRLCCREPQDGPRVRLVASQEQLADPRRTSPEEGFSECRCIRGFQCMPLHTAVAYYD